MLQVDVLRVRLPDERRIESNPFDVALLEEPLPRGVHPAEVGHGRRERLKTEDAAAGPERFRVF